VYHVQEHLQQKALDSNKVHVEHYTQVFCKMLVFGGKNYELDLSISGPVQAKVQPASFSTVPSFAAHTVPHFTSTH
jgi:hypothetical protein